MTAALPELVTSKLDAVRELCAKHQVKRLSIFGSAVKGTFDPERSDLDFVVEFDGHDDGTPRGEGFFPLWDALEALFGRRIDLVSAEFLRNPYLREELKETQMHLYAA